MSIYVNRDVLITKSMFLQESHFDKNDVFGFRIDCYIKTTPVGINRPGTKAIDIYNSLKISMVHVSCLFMSAGMF